MGEMTKNKSSKIKKIKKKKKKNVWVGAVKINFHEKCKFP